MKATVAGPENRAEFIARMEAGPVLFTYEKVDGTERKAYGTLCPELIPPKGVELFPTMAKWMERFGNYAKADGAGTPIDIDESVALIKEGSALALSLEVKSKPSAPAPEGQYRYWDFGAKGFRMFTLDKVRAFI